MIDDYLICYNISVEDLVKEIQTLIPEGYQPYGHPFVNDNEFYQAMIRHDIDAGEEPPF